MFWGILKTNKQNEAEYARHPEVLNMSKGEMYLASCMNIFRRDYGFIESADKGVALDSKGQYLPLYTYPAIEYLLQFDFSQKSVFEFGAGASTFFWMKRAKEVTSVENNREWYNRVKPQLSSNAKLLFAENDDYPYLIKQQEQKFDVIVVDGGGYRYDSAQQAIAHLADGGVIVLDNADWHHNTAKLLKSSGLLQVDMTGFKPGESHTSTTSLFLQRDFDFPVLENRQPTFGMGAKRLHSSDWDKPYAVER